MKISSFILIWTGLVEASLQGIAQSLPTRAPQGCTVYSGATIHYGNGKSINNGALKVCADTIAFSGSALLCEVLPTDSVVTLPNTYHIYPGFIAMNTTLGLMETEAVRATLDKTETGDWNPHIRALPAYNATSTLVYTTRSNGVLQWQVKPQGGIISGRSSAVQGDAFNWQDATLRADEGMHLNWPELGRYTWDAAERKYLYKPAEEYATKKDELYRLFALAKTSETPSEIRLRALQGVVRGRARLYVHCQSALEVREALDFVKHFHLKQVTLGGTTALEAHLKDLSELGISVLAPRIHSLPERRDDALTTPCDLPARLAATGIQFAFDTAGEMQEMQTRNLAFLAGSAIGCGLNEEIALQALTQWPAEMMGINHRTGTLETGKDATFFISQGKAFEPLTLRITNAFVQGRPVDLSNHQSKLYQEYVIKRRSM